MKDTGFNFIIICRLCFMIGIILSFSVDTSKKLNVIIENQAVTNLDNEEVTEDNSTEYKVEEASVPEFTTFLCPYCHNGLTTFSSSYLTSSASFICHHCDYHSPTVQINKPNAENECIELLKERLRSNNWRESDFTGEVE